MTPQDIDPRAGTPGYDSTAAIAGAIAGTSKGGTVYIPATDSGYNVSDGFLITKEVSIIGDGGTLFTGTLPAGKDLFRVDPAASVQLRGVAFKGLKSTVTGSGCVIRLRTHTTASAIAEVVISDCFLVGMANNHVIFIDNIASNPNGGTFNVNIERNTLSVNGAPAACICVEEGGDSIRIRDGILTGNGFGVYSNQVLYAGGLLVEGVNCTASGGISIIRGIKPIIRNFIIEFSGPLYTGTGINFSGSTGLVNGGTIGPGQMTAMTGASNFGGFICLSQCADVEVTGVRMQSGIAGGAGYGIYASMWAANARVGVGNSYIGLNNPVITNASTKTVQLA